MQNVGLVIRLKQVLQNLRCNFLQGLTNSPTKIFPGLLKDFPFCRICHSFSYRLTSI